MAITIVEPNRESINTMQNIMRLSNFGMDQVSFVNGKAHATHTLNFPSPFDFVFDNVVEQPSHPKDRPL